MLSKIVADNILIILIIFQQTIHMKNIYKKKYKKCRLLQTIISLPHDKNVGIMKTCLYNFDPLKPHFYTVKLGFTGVYIIFLILLKKHRLWVLIRTASLRQLIEECPQSMF